MSSNSEYYTDDESVPDVIIDIDDPVIDAVHVVAPLVNLVPVANLVPATNLVPVANLVPAANLVPVAEVVPVVNVRSVQDSVDSLIQKRSCLPSRISVLSTTPPSVNVSRWSCFPWCATVKLTTVQGDTQSQTTSYKVSDPGLLPGTVSPREASS